MMTKSLGAICVFDLESWRRPTRANNRRGLDFKARLASMLNIIGSPGSQDCKRLRYRSTAVDRNPFPASPLMYCDNFFNELVLFVDPKNSQSEAREWISAASVQTMRLTDLPDASRVAANTQSVGLIIVDLDGCGGIAVAASDLITFRLEHHEIPLILISSESACDEFGSERLAIADVTLRFPLSISRFDLALAKVEMNNLEWQHRVKCQLTTSLLKDVLEAGQRRKIY